METEPDLGPVESVEDQRAVSEVLSSLPKEFHEQSEEVKSIDLAMAHANGERRIASAAIGMNLGVMCIKICNNKYLRKRWPKVPKKPKEPEKQLIKPNGEEMRRSLDEATLKYRQELEGIDLGPKEADLGSRLFRLQMQHGLKGIALLGGGMQREAMKLITLMDELREKPYPDEYTPDGILLKSGRQATDEMILKAQSEYGRRATEYAQMTMMTAKTQQIAAETAAQSRSSANGKGKQKPGFGQLRPPPTQVLAQAGSTVVVNGNEPDEPGA